MRRLITERADKHHFALGLFGDWGTGKSSLIQQLRDRLEKDHPNILVAEFNAWKNEKATHIGAMLAQSVVDGLTADLGWWGKLKLAVRLAAKRQSRLYKDIGKDGGRILAWLETWGWVALPPLLALLATGLLLWVLPTSNSPLAPYLAGIAGLGLALAATYRSVAGFLKDNLTEWFKLVGVEKPGSLLQLPSYGEHRGLLGEIHRALTHLCEAQLGDGKSLLLIVDDLDRCCVNAVKEVLDAVRLVADIPRVMTIVAIDERMAFAAVEKHYDQFGHAGRAPALVAREYLSKVLQASVSLPEVGDKEIDSFVTETLFKDVEAQAKKDASEAEMNKANMSVEPHDSALLGPKTPAPETAPDKASGQGDSAPSNVPDSSGRSGQSPVSSPASGASNDADNATPSQKPFPEEVSLFAELAKAYRFGNPRLLGRLNLAWRLLKALRYRGKSYRFAEVENGLSLLFWREFRLQQEAEKRDALDAWFAALGSETAPTPAESLNELSKTLEAVGEALAKVKEDANWSNADALVDSVLLPASVKQSPGSKDE